MGTGHAVERYTQRISRLYPRFQDIVVIPCTSWNTGLVANESSKSLYESVLSCIEMVHRTSGALIPSHLCTPKMPVNYIMSIMTFLYPAHLQ